jgi:hypothetical protein
MILEKRKYKFNQKAAKILALFLGGFIMILSFLRENIFLEINAILNGYAYSKAYFYFLNEKLSSLTPTQLMTLKWLLTILFILVISGLTLLTIQLWFKNKEFNRISMIVYSFAFGVVVLTTLFLWLTGNYTSYYFVIRKMIGFLHSPIPLFLFFTVYMYLKISWINT